MISYDNGKKGLNASQFPDGSSAPALFQLISWTARYFEYLEQCTGKYGDIFTMRILGVPPFVVVANPQGIRDVFCPDSRNFEAGSTNNDRGGRLIMGEKLGRKFATYCKRRLRRSVPTQKSGVMMS